MKVVLLSPTCPEFLGGLTVLLAGRLRLRGSSDLRPRRALARMQSASNCTDSEPGVPTLQQQLKWGRNTHRQRGQRTSGTRASKGSE